MGERVYDASQHSNCQLQGVDALQPSLDHVRSFKDAHIVIKDVTIASGRGVWLAEGKAHAERILNAKFMGRSPRNSELNKFIIIEDPY